MSVINTEKLPDAVELVRRLAGLGSLKQHAAAAPDGERRRLRAAACEIAWPLVFSRVTRTVERKRGHPVCATAMQRLAPDCLDRFHDDVEAVLDDLFANADVPIHNLEGWLTTRLLRATVDAHRRRRGKRGAPQRPRVPLWLATGLGGDTWLVELAKAILDWVGVDATAGTGVWPLAAWADLRAAMTGDHTAGEAAIAADVARVLAAMQRRPVWYERNVERPLGCKQAPVWLAGRTATDPVMEPQPLALVARHEVDDALLSELAAAALDALRHRIGRGEDPKQVVLDVLGAVFGDVSQADDLDRVPGAGPAAGEQVMALVSDPARLDRVIATVVELLGEQAHR